MSSVSNFNKTIDSVVNTQSFNSYIKDISKDGRIDKKEVNQLKDFINETRLPEKEKNKINSFIDSLGNSTTGVEEKGFFIFKSTEEVTKNLSENDISSLKNLAGKNKIADALLKSVTESQNSIKKDTLNTNNKISSKAEFDPVSDGVSFSNSKKEVISNSKSSPKIESSQPQSFSYAQSKNKLMPEENIGKFHVDQFSGLPSENGDCGPSSAAMILKANGFDVDVTKVRQTVGVTKPRGGAWALSENEIKKGIEKLSGGEIKEVARKGFNAKNQDNLVAYLRKELEAGRMPMLETGAVNVNSRHYTVVLGIDDNGGIRVADPSNPYGVSLYDADMLPAMMAKADKRGGSFVMSYAKQ